MRSTKRYLQGCIYRHEPVVQQSSCGAAQPAARARCCFSLQVEALRQDAGRLQSDNSQLHVQLIQAKEQQAASGKDTYQEAKRLEGRIAELAFWKQQAQQQLQQADRDNAALRQRVAELVAMADQLASGTRRPSATVAGGVLGVTCHAPCTACGAGKGPPRPPRTRPPVAPGAVHAAA